MDDDFVHVEFVVVVYGENRWGNDKRESTVTIELPLSIAETDLSEMVSVLQKSAILKYKLGLQEPKDG